MQPARLSCSDRNLYTACSIAAFLLFAVLTAQAAEPRNVVQISDGSASFELKQVDSGKSLLMVTEGKELRIGQCSETSFATVPNPTSELVASVVIRNCGATTDFATHVTLARAAVSKSVAVFAGKPRTDVSWIAGSLQISRPGLPPQSVFLENTEAFGVTVAYVENREGEGNSDPIAIEFSSFNFGATGRAAGVPKELLLRWAGWSQMASGLHRPEWGAWSQSPPYGDDPSGSESILRGIQYYDTKYRK
jgi:hypothetical protein